MSSKAAKHSAKYPFSDNLYSRLWPSGRTAQRINNGLAQSSGKFSHLVFTAGQAKTSMSPVVLTYGGQGIGKGGPRLTVPSILRKRQGVLTGEAVGQQRHQRKYY